MAAQYKKIQDLIDRKISSSAPVYPTVTTATETLTDKFAYPSWYRGDPRSSSPIIAERTAGWRPQKISNYPAFMHVGARTSGGYLQAPVSAEDIKEETRTASNGKTQYFQTSCSTVFPYYSSEEKVDQSKMFNTLNNNYTYMLSKR